MNLTSAKLCWICYESDADDHTLKNLSQQSSKSRATNYNYWITPCVCRGSSKWVHQHCLHRWIDEKWKSQPISSVKCSVCKTPYIITYPKSTFTDNIMTVIDDFLNKMSPFLIGTMFVSGIYWVTVSYSVISMFQILGFEKTQEFLSNSDYVMMAMGLPVIPFTLVAARLIPWELFLISKLRNITSRHYILQRMFGIYNIPPWRRDHVFSPTTTIAQQRTYTRTIAESLLTPTFSWLTGNLFFNRVKPHWKRSLLGGSVYYATSILFNMIFQHRRFLRDCKREIKNYSDATAEELAEQERLCEADKQDEEAAQLANQALVAPQINPSSSPESYDFAAHQSTHTNTQFDWQIEGGGGATENHLPSRNRNSSSLSTTGLNLSNHSDPLFSINITIGGEGRAESVN